MMTIANLDSLWLVHKEVIHSLHYFIILSHLETDYDTQLCTDAIMKISSKLWISKFQKNHFSDSPPHSIGQKAL